ncbi:unnamed protein product [Nippostrongylus brasiliensis]|uniref:RING-type domain-containing protein n=1 Tax=Nippostrongylus brasiliensis TaxID=27835 RepID=A0A158R0D0_NIPBR|nr:unnamed protein product [Nippostrongylus brasiliensis]
MEQIVGPIGHDPTAPSDLNTVTETLWFDSATIVAALIVTFFVFYFIDFFMQLFGRVSTMMSADPTPSVASLQPVIPTRTRRRRRTGTSMSRETTPNYTSVHWPSDSTQASLTPSPAQPMMDIVTKSIRPNFSREICVPPNNPPPAKVNPDIPSPKVDSATLKLSSERKLAGRSPTNHYATPEHWKNPDTVHLETKGCERCCSREWLRMCGFVSPPAPHTSCRLGEEAQDYDDLSSVEFNIDERLIEEQVMNSGDHVYDESHGLPYADDISGEEFDSYRYEHSQACTLCTKQLDDLRTEFSIDDVSNSDDIREEWEDEDEEENLSSPCKSWSDEVRADSLYEKAENILNKLQKHRHARHHVDVSRKMGSSVLGFVQHCESLLSGADESLHLEDGDNTERSISSFDITQSIETRHHHHVLFTYPDPTPYKMSGGGIKDIYHFVEENLTCKPDRFGSDSEQGCSE